MLRVNRNRIPSLVFILGLILTYVELAETAIAATDDELAVIYQSKKYSHLIDVLAREEKESWNIEKSYLLFKTYNQLKDYNQSKRVLGFIEHNLPSGFENLLLFEKINLFKMTIGDLDLLFEDEGLNRMPTQIFDAYMSSKTQKDVINKFSALGDRLVDQKSLHDTIMKFDDQVFTNFDLSVLSN